FPLQFVGIWMWRKHTKADGNIEAKVMDNKQKAYLAIGSIFAVALYSLILTKLGGNVPIIDATSTVLSVIAMILMLKMYAEQWLLWIVVNGVSIVMWIFPLLQGQQGAIAMILMWIAYFANAVYGYINWKKMAE
ncbi:MAG: nicotinamide riboside transporter PnuC, partial [Bacteroides sp.]